MSFAEKKVELFKIVAEADEEMTSQLIEFANQLKSSHTAFSAEDLAEFDRRRTEYLKHPANVFSAEESLLRLRNKLEK